MSLCPRCNQLETNLEEECPRCNRLMEDRGRVMDYFDDYSAYLDIDGMKRYDGYADDYSRNLCPHIYYCPQCTHNKVVFVNEIIV